MRNMERGQAMAETALFATLAILMAFGLLAWIPSHRITEKIFMHVPALLGDAAKSVGVGGCAVTQDLSQPSVEVKCVVGWDSVHGLTESITQSVILITAHC